MMLCDIIYSILLSARRIINFILMLMCVCVYVCMHVCIAAAPPPAAASAPPAPPPALVATGVHSQEVGRAGRDGDPAKCTLLLSKEDVTRQHSLSHTQTLGTLQIMTLFRRLFVPAAASRGATQGEAIEFESEVAISLDRAAQEGDIAGDSDHL
jgi:hypothetical protein